MQELLEARLGDLTPLAFTAVLVLPVFAWALTFLERSRRIAAPATASLRSLRTDLGYLLLSPASELFSRIVTTLGIVSCALLLGYRVGPALLRGFGPLAEQPRALIVIEMLVIGDFFFYWTHRLAHTVPCLWRLHAVHHSTSHMRWSSALRTHPGEAYVQLIHLLPLFLIGLPIEALVPVTPIVTLYALFIHSDLNISLRPVSYLFNSPLFHRWHHARDVRDGTTNFAGMFPIYDALFGTYRLPTHAPREVGIDDSTMPDTCIGQLAYPFFPQRTHALHESCATRDSRVPTTSAARKPEPNRGRAGVASWSPLESRDVPPWLHPRPARSQPFD